MEFVDLRKTIVICILPQTQVRKDGVLSIENLVFISTVCAVVKFSKGEKAVRLIARGLGSEISKELRGIINCVVGVAVKHQPGIIRIRFAPRHSHGSVALAPDTPWAACRLTPFPDSRSRWAKLSAYPSEKQNLSCGQHGSFAGVGVGDGV